MPNLSYEDRKSINKYLIEEGIIGQVNTDFQYTYNDNTTNPTTNKQFKTNNNDFTLATELVFSYRVRGNVDISNLVKFRYEEGVFTGKIYIQKNNNSDVFAIYDISNITYDDENNQFILSVSYSSGNPNFAQNNIVICEIRM